MSDNALVLMDYDLVYRRPGAERWVKQVGWNLFVVQRIDGVPHWGNWFVAANGTPTCWDFFPLTLPIEPEQLRDQEARTHLCAFVAREAVARDASLMIGGAPTTAEQLRSVSQAIDADDYNEANRLLEVLASVLGSSDPELVCLRAFTEWAKPVAKELTTFVTVKAAEEVGGFYAFSEEPDLGAQGQTEGEALVALGHAFDEHARINRPRAAR